MSSTKKYSQSLQKRLKTYRLACGLSQSQIADRLGIDRSTYTYYETGRFQPSLDILGILCKIYNVSFNELLGSDESSLELNDAEPSSSAVSSLHPLENERLNTLSRDEKDLILRFRMLSDTQRKEFLYSVGITETKTTN